MLNLKSFLLVLFITVFQSCNNEVSLNSETDLTIYSKLKEQITIDLNELGNSLRSNNVKFSDTELVLKTAKEIFISNNEYYNSFKESFNRSLYSNARINSENETSEIVKQSIQEIQFSISNFSTLEEFQSFLSDQLVTIAYSDMVKEDKEFMLTYLTVYSSSLDFIKNNKDLIVENQINGRTQGWWDDWGKCAAGILGGAGTGALTFGLGGAAIGTVTLPVIGTVSAGAVGAIGGAISGGLTGAAASCGNSK